MNVRSAIIREAAVRIAPAHRAAVGVRLVAWILPTMAGKNRSLPMAKICRAWAVRVLFSAAADARIPPRTTSKYPVCPRPVTATSTSGAFDPASDFHGTTMTETRATAI